MLVKSFFSRRTAQTSRRPVRPALESLETRLAPAVVRWITNADGNWNDCGSWRVDGTNPPQFRCPGAGDDAVIGVGIDATITFTGNHQVRSLTSAERLDMMSGTLTLSDVLPATSSTAVDLIIRNGAALRLASGTLQIGNRATIAGTLQVDEGMTVSWGGCGGTFDSYIIGAGASFPGLGAHIMNNCTDTTVTGDVTLPRNLTINNIFRIDAGVTVTTGPSLTLLNTISGAGTFRVPAGARLDWLTGTMTDSGTTRVEAGATLALSGTGGRALSGTRGLNNAGSATWTDAGNLTLAADTALNNLAGGTFTAQGDSAIISSGAFNNAGTFAKVGSGGTTRVGNFHNLAGGTVNVSSGTLQLGSGTSNAAFTVAAGATLLFPGNYTLDAGTTLGGSGQVQVGVPQAFGTVVLNEDVTVANFHLFSETLAGTGNLTVTDTFTWTGGSMAGTGVTTLAAGATMNISYGLLNRTLRNAGTINWLPDSGFFDIQGQGVLNNEGIFNAQGNQPQHFLRGAGAINNTGTFRRSSTEGSSVVQVAPPLNNTGTVQALGGVLALTANDASSGTFDVAPEGTLTFAGGTHVLNTGVTFTGAGCARVFSGTVNIVGDVTAANLCQEGGTLTGPGTLTVTGTFDWTGGSMTNPNGVTAIAAGGALILSGNSLKTLNGRTLDLDGITLWLDGGNLTLTNGGIIRNQANGVFIIYHEIDVGPSGSGAFSNAGFLLKLGPARTTLGAAFSNNGGFVFVLDGSFGVTGTYSQNSGSTDVAGTLGAGGATGVDLRGGSLTLAGQITGNVTVSGADALFQGTGTITGNLTNAGQVHVGGAGTAGLLTVGGIFTQQATGVLAMELGGTAEAQYDRLRVIGRATLDGTLAIALIDDYMANVGDSFRVLEAAGGRNNTTFAAISGLNLGDRQLDPRYDATGLTLMTL